MSSCPPFLLTVFSFITSGVKYMLQIFLCLTNGMIIKSTLGENEYQVCCDIRIQETHLVRNEYQV